MDTRILKGIGITSGLEYCIYKELEKVKRKQQGATADRRKSYNKVSNKAEEK